MRFRGLRLSVKGLCVKRRREERDKVYIRMLRSNAFDIFCVLVYFALGAV